MRSKRCAVQNQGITLSNEDDDSSETSQTNDFGSILNRSIRQI